MQVLKAGDKVKLIRTDCCYKSWLTIKNSKGVPRTFYDKLPPTRNFKGVVTFVGAVDRKGLYRVCIKNATQGYVVDNHCLQLID